MTGLLFGRPFAERARGKGSVVVTAVACHFAAEPFGAFEGRIDRREFDFRHGLARIGTEKLIDFVGQFTGRNEPAHFFHCARQTQGEQQARFVGRDLFLPLET